MDWKTMTEKPTKPLQAELFYGRLRLTDMDGKEVSAVIQPYRDERRQLGYWDGEAWYHMGTAHRVYEFQDTPVEWFPTHWRKLPDPPRRGRQ